MSAAPQDIASARMAEFMRLLPLTEAIAGLPHCEHGKSFTEGQLEVRCLNLKAAFKMAKQVLRDISQG
ncbi:MAG: hypothetical protein ACKO9Z_08865 [Planctomycetota bacterium]|jgi:hypothetical protein|nr:hypothetical protein [Planctomycetota bacterium]